jgi:hypothetical protein
MMSVEYRGSIGRTGRSSSDTRMPSLAVSCHGIRQLELSALRHGRLLGVEDVADEVVCVILGLLVVVGQCIVVLGRRRRSRLPCSTRRRKRVCRRQRFIKWVVPVADEPRLPLRMPLGLASAVQ